MDDLHWLREVGLAEKPIVEYARHRVPVVGICGGYQMLGRTLRDPRRIESWSAEPLVWGYCRPKPSSRQPAPTTHRAVTRSPPLPREPRAAPSRAMRSIWGQRPVPARGCGSRIAAESLSKPPTVPFPRTVGSGGAISTACSRMTFSGGRPSARSEVARADGRRFRTGKRLRADDQLRGQARAIAESPGRLRRKRHEEEHEETRANRVERDGKGQSNARRREHQP